MRLLPALLVVVSAAAHAETRILNRRLEANQTVAHVLHASGLSNAEVEGVIGALRGVLDFTRCRPGDQLRMVVREGELDFFDYRQGPLDEWQVHREGERLVGYKRDIEIEKVVGVVELRVRHSLYVAAVEAGEDPAIAMALADVFAWDIDFFQDVRRGDLARAVVEKYVSRGRVVRYGEVLAASYEGESVGVKKVFRHTLPDGSTSYFQEDGSSARKSFLKSPLKFANVTSRFGGRLHPVLKYYKAHNGVDYRAGVGTPVWAMADGVVTVRGYDRASGRKLCVRHRSSLETCFAHLSGFGPGIRVGTRVHQKQVVAYTGNTGRSTGPHLHYALKRGGRFVNPLNQNFPRADPVPAGLLGEFREAIAPWVTQLEAAQVASEARAPDVLQEG